jgi:hypothetical protein
LQQITFYPKLLQHSGLTRPLHFYAFILKMLTPTFILIDRAPASLGEIMVSFVNLSSSLSLRYLFMEATYGPRPRTIRKNGVIFFILCSLLTIILAASDCEILNSGISSISSTHWINEHIFERSLCEWQSDEDVRILYLNSISRFIHARGQLPVEIGQITELIEIDFDLSDLSGGPVPESIGMCTKLEKLRLKNYNFPKAQVTRYILLWI